MDTNKLYDFENLDGLPANLANAISKGNTGKDQEFLNAIKSAVVNAPMPLGIKKIMAVLFRMGVTMKGEATVREYLNTLVASGDIVKPTSQSYSDANAVTTMAHEANTAVPEATEVEVDNPLSDL